MKMTQLADGSDNTADILLVPTCDADIHSAEGHTEINVL